MKRKMVSMALAVVLFIGLLPAAPALAEYKGELVFRVTDGSGILTPQMVGDQYTAAFGRDDFYTFSATFDSTVRQLGYGVFSTDLGKYLTGVSFGSRIEAIGMWAFAGCEKLTSIVIPDNVKTIDSSAFRECFSLENVDLGEGVEYLGQSVFYKTKLRSIVIPDSVTSISSELFNNCSLLSDVRIGSGLREIPNWTFRLCPSLERIEIPDTITTIGEGAFQDCTSLQAIDIPKSVTSIGISAFRDCTNLSEVTFYGDAPNADTTTFSDTASGATANVYPSAKGFPEAGGLWNGLVVRHLNVGTLTTITAPTVTAYRGDTVTIPIQVENSPGISGFMLDVAYEPSKLSLVSADCEALGGDWMPGKNLNGVCRNLWVGNEPFKADGDLYYITFQIAADCPEGDIPLNISGDLADKWGNKLPVTFVAGAVTVIGTETDFTCGDINGDGLIDISDIVLLKAYLLEDIDFDARQMLAANVYLDDAIDASDLLTLMQYVADGYGIDALPVIQ